MALSDVMKEIEGLTFSAELNLAAGKKAFRRNMLEHALFKELMEVAKTPLGRKSIADRITKLTAQPRDDRYEHPADVAFSSYLTALAETAEPEMIAAVARVVTTAPNCSWAAGIARDLPRAVPTDRGPETD